MIEEIKILLICDDKGLAKYFKTQLSTRKGFSVSFAQAGEEGLKVFESGNFDVVVIQLVSFNTSSQSLISSLKAKDPDCIIIALLEEADTQVLRDLFGAGVYDFLTRPIDLEKLSYLAKKAGDMHRSMVANRRLIERLKDQNTILERQNNLLSKRVGESNKNLTKLYEDLRTTYMKTIKVLAQAIDARDHYTHSHSENVARFSEAIATEMDLPVKEVSVVREACELHDLGKIGIEDNILGKAFTLSVQEWEKIKLHPAMGAQILEPLTFLGDVVDLIKQHHENYDGSGYPDGRKGDQILMGARIIRVADAYDAMRSSRSYRKQPLSKDKAIAELRKNSGSQFDPQVVEAFLRVVDNLDSG